MVAPNLPLALADDALAFVTINRQFFRSILPDPTADNIHMDGYGYKPSAVLGAKRKRNNAYISSITNKTSAFSSRGFLNPESSSNEYAQGTMDTALCIIPPDDAWDDIQRARHFAKDPSFYTWPPAIRLFHPFVERATITEVSSAVAELIEKYELESFDVTIDKLLIVPHFEDLQLHEDAQRQLPDQASIIDKGPSEDEERVQALIRSEERKGKRKLAKRKAKEKIVRNGKQDNSSYAEEDSAESPINEPSQVSSKEKSPKDMLKNQRKRMGEFNGPCVLCLEPSEESKIHIQAFREILRKKLFANYDPFSPSSTVTNPNALKLGLPRSILKQHGVRSPGSKLSKKKEGCTFRPTITLGRFSTVTKAVEVANTLQRVWEPLSFRVCDLHMVSKLETTSISSRNEDEMDESDSLDPYSIQVDEHGTPTLHENRELTLRKFHGSDGSESILSTKGEYGCDGKSYYFSIPKMLRAIVLFQKCYPKHTLAMIMLKGEENQLLKKNENIGGEEIFEDEDGNGAADETSFYMDEEDEQRIMELLLSPAAIPGGQGDTRNEKDIQKESEENLQSWLEEDEDIDEGATIIIGRTQFFMGEMRQYTGMPASSTMDGKDRVLGDSDVSGAARRRGAVHRQGDRWQEGDYGRKEKDFLP